MKLLAKIGVVAVLGTGATMYASPGGSVPDPSSAVARAAAIHDQAMDDFNNVTHLQSDARKNKDLIALSCVNDKLVQIKPEMNLVDGAQGAIASAQDDAARASALDVAVQAGREVHELGTAAGQCIGKPLLTTDSANDFTHPDLIEHLPMDPIGGGGDPVEPPAYASPVN